MKRFVAFLTSSVFLWALAAQNDLFAAGITPIPGGAVVAWGSQTTVPAAAQRGVVAIAAGNGYSLALTTNGSVLAWGVNEHGQTDVPVAAQSGVIAIAAGLDHSLALTTNGSVVGWGWNLHGETAVPKAAQSGVIAISAGGSHSLALKNDGSVVAWGDNTSGQTSIPAAAQSEVIAISAGAFHSLALKTDGSVVAWGYNGSGQASVPTQARSGVIAISAGGYHNLVLKIGGSVFAWGDNGFGQTTVPAAAQSEVTAIAAGDAHGLALKNDGSVVAWGWNRDGQIDVPVAAQSGVFTISAGYSHSLALVPLRSPTINAAPISQSVISGQYTTFAVRAEGTPPLAYQWLRNDVAIPNANQSSFNLFPTKESDAGSYAVIVRNAGGAITSAPPAVLTVKPPGSVVAWGDNYYGQTTVPVAARSGVIAIATGYFHNLALKTGGSVVAWGSNGNGRTTVPAAAESGVIAIAAGGQHSLALTTNGLVVAWGSNDSGQTTLPAGAQSGVIAIAAGGSHSLVLTTDGSVVAWGDNYYGQSTVPAAAQSGVMAIAAGGVYSLALKTDGSVVAWGARTTVPAAAQSGVIAIAAGSSHSLALKTDGTVVAWDWRGRQIDVPVAALSGVTAIAMGEYDRLALKTDGSVVAWGSQTPVPAEAQRGVIAIAAGYYHNLALTSLPIISTQPSSQSARYRETATFNVSAYGEQPFTYQWARNGTPILGATNPIYSVKVTSDGQAGKYSVVVANPHGSVSSAEALLQPDFRPIILDLVGPVAGLSRKPFEIEVQADGAPPLSLSYSWLRSGTAIPGANSSLLNVPEGEETSVVYTAVVTNSYGRAEASISITITNFLRRLPAGYWPGLPVVVEIEYAPKRGTFNHTVTETLPKGTMPQLVPEYYNADGQPIAYKEGAALVSLTAGNINEDGIFDPASGTVKWGPFFDHDPRVLRYTIVPPLGWSSPVSFKATISEDGTSKAFGEQTLSLYPLHPADNGLNGQPMNESLPIDSRITFTEVNAYATAWRRSLFWPVPPNPIPPDGNYLTQAGLIWRRGEKYRDNGGAAPGRWQPVNAFTPLAASKSAVVESNPALLSEMAAKLIAVAAPPPARGTALRSALTRVDPVEPFTITVTVTPDENATVLLVEEQLPLGWSAREINSGGSVDPEFNKIKWGPFFSSSPRKLVYLAVPPADAMGHFNFSGRVGIDGSEFPIEGATTITLGSPPPISLSIRRTGNAIVLHWPAGTEYRLQSSTFRGTCCLDWSDKSASERRDRTRGHQRRFSPPTILSSG